MTKYILLCHEESNKINYYYNFEDGCVYWLDVYKNVTNASKAGGIGGRYGGVLGIFLYPLVRRTTGGLVGVPLTEISIIVAILAALWMEIWEFKTMRRFFTPQNRMVVSKEHIRQMFLRGKKIQRKYFWTEIFLFFLAVVMTGFAEISQSTVYFLLCMLGWWLFFLAVFADRPICTLQFKHRMRKGTL